MKTSVQIPKQSLFILFQTDLHKSLHSRVCFGVFSSFDKANSHAKENDLYSCQSEVVIIECTLDEFVEI